MRGAKIVQVVVEGGVSVWRYWLFLKTRQVEQPPLFLDVLLPGNDTSIHPLFWIDAADEYSPKHRSRSTQFVGGGDIGWSKKQGEVKEPPLFFNAGYMLLSKLLGRLFLVGMVF